jgi:hypothetical protein
MNFRLLNATDKAKNKLDRVERRNTVKRLKRRAAIQKEAPFVTGILFGSTGELTSEEMWKFENGHGHEIRRIVRKMKYLDAAFDWPVAELPVVPEDELRVVERPSRVLQERNRGRSPAGFNAPPIDLSDAPIDQGSNATSVYLKRKEVVDRFRACPCPSRIVQAYHALSKWSGTTYTAYFVNLYGLSDPPLKSSDVEKAMEVMRYPGPFDEAREGYAAAVAAWNIPLAKGDWGLRLSTDLERLRPGIQIPSRLQRDVYLLNFIDVQFGEPREIDFYSIHYKPLFRLPFGSDAAKGAFLKANRDDLPTEEAPIHDANPSTIYQSEAPKIRPGPSRHAYTYENGHLVPYRPQS